MTDILSTYYKKAAFYPLVFAFVTGAILMFTHDGSRYKSEWSTDDGFVESILMIFFLSIIIAALSLTIFLNNFQVIKINWVYSLLSWTIPASLVCFCIIYFELQNLFSQHDYEGNILLDSYCIAIAFAHLAGLIITYVFFRRGVSKQYSG